MSHKVPPQGSAFLVRRLTPSQVAWHPPEGEPVTFHCQPPLPTPLPLGFLVELQGGENSWKVHLWPSGREGELVALPEMAVAAVASASLEQLVNHIAHDLRNLFFTISLQAELAARQGGEVTRNLQVILGQLERVQRYLERLLLYGRKPVLSPTTLSVETFLRERLRTLKQQWPAHLPPLSVRLVVNGEAGLARWDPHLLSLALEAVLDNAARATPAGHEVEVLVHGEAQQVILEVQDHGPGIPPHLLSQVFFPMAARRPQGMGLGLPIARKLVEAHGGTLELESSPQGTRVRLLLPREAPLS